MAKLFRENDSIVFTHEDVVIKKWDQFGFIKNAKSVLVLTSLDDKDFTPLSIYDFKKQNSLNSFLDEEQLDKAYKAYFKKFRHVVFYQKYKISTKNFKRIFNSIMKEIWVVEPYFSKFCFNNKKPKEHLVQKLKQNLHLLQKTRNKNVLPMVFWSGLSEENLENIFGEDLWKELLKNSEHKNTLLARRIFKSDNLHQSNLLHPTRIPVEFKKWNQIKSTVLKKLWFYTDFDFVCILQKLFKAKDLATPWKKFKLSLASTASQTTEQIKEIEEIYNTAVRHKEKYSIHWDIKQWMKLNEKFKSHGWNEYN